MMNWIAKTALKFLSYDALVEMVAKAIAYILEYARKKASPEAWEKAKEANRRIKAWTTLLDEVYEDDTLTSDEEKKVAEAIANCTVTESIYNLVTGNGKRAKGNVASKPANQLRKVKRITKTPGK